MTIMESIAARLLVPALRWVSSKASEIRKQHMFSVCFVDHDPPESREVDLGDLHPIRLGQSIHWVKVVTEEGLPVSDINMRFITEGEAAATPRNTPEAITSTIEIRDVTLTPEISQQGHTVTRTKDRHGGIDIKIQPPYAWGKGRALFFRVEVDANGDALMEHDGAASRNQSIPSRVQRIADEHLFFIPAA